MIDHVLVSQLPKSDGAEKPLTPGTRPRGPPRLERVERGLEGHEYCYADTVESGTSQNPLISIAVSSRQMASILVVVDPQGPTGRCAPAQESMGRTAPCGLSSTPLFLCCPPKKSVRCRRPKHCRQQQLLLHSQGNSWFCCAAGCRLLPDEPGQSYIAAVRILSRNTCPCAQSLHADAQLGHRSRSTCTSASNWTPYQQARMWQLRSAGPASQSGLAAPTS